MVRKSFTELQISDELREVFTEAEYMQAKNQLFKRILTEIKRQEIQIKDVNYDSALFGFSIRIGDADNSILTIRADMHRSCAGIDGVRIWIQRYKACSITYLFTIKNLDKWDAKVVKFITNLKPEIQRFLIVKIRDAKEKLEQIDKVRSRLKFDIPSEVIDFKNSDGKWLRLKPIGDVSIVLYVADQPNVKEIDVDLGYIPQVKLASLLPKFMEVLRQDA